MRTINIQIKSQHEESIEVRDDLTSQEINEVVEEIASTIPNVYNIDWSYA